MLAHKEYDKILTSYMDSFFDFNSLISYIELTYKGKQRYKQYERNYRGHPYDYKNQS